MAKLPFTVLQYLVEHETMVVGHSLFSFTLYLLYPVDFGEFHLIPFISHSSFPVVPSFV